MTIVGIGYGEADELPQRWPTESQNRGVGSCLSGRREELPVEGGARNCIIKGVVKAVYEDKQISASIGQIARNVGGETALVRVLYETIDPAWSAPTPTPSTNAVP